jgi:hypothetical protein
MDINDIEGHPEPIIPQTKIIEKKYGYMERDPNKKLTYYERAMLMFDEKNKIPFKEKTPWGKIKSIISMTLAVVLTPIIFVAIIPLCVCVFFCACVSCIGIFFLEFYNASCYFCEKISNFLENTLY